MRPYWFPLFFVFLLFATSCGEEKKLPSAPRGEPGSSAEPSKPEASTPVSSVLDAWVLSHIQEPLRVSFVIRDLSLFRQLFEPSRRVQEGRIQGEGRVRREILHCHFNSDLQAGAGSILVGRMEKLRVASAEYHPDTRFYQVLLVEERGHFNFGCLRSLPEDVTLGELRAAFGAMVSFGIVDGRGHSIEPDPTPTPLPISTPNSNPIATPTASQARFETTPVRDLSGRSLVLEITDRSKFTDLARDSETLRVQAGRILSSDEIDLGKPYCYVAAHRGIFGQGDQLSLARITEETTGRTRALDLMDLKGKITLSCYKKNSSLLLQELRAVFLGIGAFSI